MIGEEGWRLRKAASLVKLLALAEGHRLHRERAMELLWPDLKPEAALNNLHHALHVARRTLEPALTNNAASRHLNLRGDLIELCPHGPLWVDAEAFEGAAAARRGREPAAYRAAMELYAGDLLPEDLYEEWTQEKREELRRSYHALLSELAALYEERGEYGAATEASRRVVAQEPTREEAHAGLMRLHALSGRHQEAILQYERLRKALREELDQEPTEASRRLYEGIRAGKFPAASSPPAAGRPSGGLSDSLRNNNLPASLTSFVGREGALLEVKRLLSMGRLLTLTGAGGSGKTRLALEVARDLVGAYPEGAWLVELAPLSDPELVARAVAQALGVREQPGCSVQEALSNYLKPRQTLLVMDNCEHLVGAVAPLADALLSTCPRLKLLATSREPLGVPGEALWAVPPLSPSARRARRRDLHLRRGPREDRGGKALLRPRPLAAARLRAERIERGGSGEDLPQAGGDTASHRAGGADGGPGGRAGGPEARRFLEAAYRRRPDGRTPPADLAGDAGLEPRAVGRARAKALRAPLGVRGGRRLEAAEEVCSGGGIGREEVVDLLSKLVDKSLVVA